MEFLRNVIIRNGSGMGPASQPEHEVVQSGEGTRDDGQVCFGFIAKQGRRQSMEDFTYSQFKRCKNGEQFGFFGVFDGHGGPAAASFVSNNLFVALENDPDFPDNMQSALRKAFLKTDDDYLNSAQAREDGCTGVVAVVRERRVWIAHVGDSRAVHAKSSGQVEALSEDHKPNRESERRRIENEGGVVIWAGTWRVGGVLAVSRAFGDRPLKRYVIAEPDVHTQAMEMVDEAIILASDGLWDVMENQEAGKLAREQPSALLAAEGLAVEAFERGSADNISCVVIRFGS